MERIPILRMGEFLLVTIQADMHDELAGTLQHDLTDTIQKRGSTGVLIDISSLELVDSFIGRMIANIAAMARILDARTVLVGMQPAVAITLVELGLTLPGCRQHWMWSGAWRCCDATGGAPRPRWKSSRSHSRRATGMPASRSEELPLRSGADVVKVRQVVRTWAAELGFSLVDQTKLVTGASELARNTLDHGRGGSVRLGMLDDDGRRGLGMMFEDQG